MARGCGCKIQSCRVALQCGLKFLISAFQAEKDLVVDLVVLEARRIVGLNKIEVKVPLRHSSGALVGGAEKEVACTRNLMRLPDQFVLPDLVAGDVGGVLAFHDPLECLVIEAVELSLAQAFSPFVD